MGLRLDGGIASPSGDVWIPFLACAVFAISCSWGIENIFRNFATNPVAITSAVSGSQEAAPGTWVSCWPEFILTESSMEPCGPPAPPGSEKWSNSCFGSLGEGGVRVV